MYGFGVDNVKNQQAKHRWLSRKKKKAKKKKKQKKKKTSQKSGNHSLFLKEPSL